VNGKVRRLVIVFITFIFRTYKVIKDSINKKPGAITNHPINGKCYKTNRSINGKIDSLRIHQCNRSR
jgi:hypothetical protein